MSDIDREEELQDTQETWSVSRLQTIQTCGNKYKLRYIEHAPEVKGVALKFGSIVHHLIDQIHKHEVDSIGDLQEKFVDAWAASRTWDWTGELMTPLQYKNRGLKMLEKYWSGHGDDAVIASEVRFDFQLYPPLTGVIDKIQEIEPGVLAIIDFKTSKNPPDWTVLRRDLQLTTYRYAASLMGYKINHFAIHHLLSGEVYWTWRDQDDVKDLMLALDDARKKVEYQLFARNIDYHCRWCSFKEACLNVGGVTTGELAHAE